MIAVELVRPGTTEPDAELDRPDRQGLPRPGRRRPDRRHYGNVLRFLPPLVIGQDLLAEGLDVLDAAFAEHAPAR